MTPQIENWLKLVRESYEFTPGRVLEIGSRNVNGTPRVFFQDAEEYIGIDMEAGPGVDLVMNSSEVLTAYEPQSFDTVIICECLEHDPNFRSTVLDARTLLKSNGVLIITTPTFGFPLHRFPKDYWRFGEDAYREVFFDGMQIGEVVLLDSECGPGTTIAGIAGQLKAVVKREAPQPLRFKHPDPYTGQRKLRVGYIEPDDTGCSYTRQVLPCETLRKFNMADVYACHKLTNWQQITKAPDLCYTGRAANFDFVNLLKKLQYAGVPVVVDYDDSYLHGMDPFSPHYAEWGVEEFECDDAEGKRIRVWVDGVNFSIKENETRVKELRQVMAEFDLLTTTTELLAAELREVNPNVAVIPNCQDLSIIKPLPFKPRDDVRLFWAGAASHYHDWVLLQEALYTVMKRHPEVKLIIQGCPFEPTLRFLDKSRIELRYWVPPKAYPYALSMTDVDIGLIPLQDKPWNRKKSANKWVEFSGLGIPSVVSNVSPYKEMENGGNIFLVENDRKAWIEGICYLIENKEERLRIGRAARADCEQRFDIVTQWPQWLNVFEGLVKERNLLQEAVNV